MAEYTTVSGVDVLDDAIATLNGSALSAGPNNQPVAQRVKLGYGADGAYNDLTAEPARADKQDAAKTSTDKITTGATPHPSTANTTDVALTSVAGKLMSFSCAETTGSAGAKFYLRDGNDSTGTIVAIVTLAPGESVRDSFAPQGIALTQGLWLDRVSGTTEVTAAVA